MFHYNNLVCREDVSSVPQDKDHEISNVAPETELQLVEGSEVDKLNEESLPIKDTHQVGYAQEAPHNVILLEYLSTMLNH